MFSVALPGGRLHDRRWLNNAMY